jgi:NADH:ubiquinone reductase (H+-translocating)
VGPEHPSLREDPSQVNRRSDVVIVGAGFAGLEVAKELGKAGIETTIIDRHNHHLFQPLLYQVATAALSATDVAEPIRKILRRQKSVQVLFGEVSEIDTGARVVRMTCGHVVGYRWLVLAVGAATAISAMSNGRNGRRV